MKKIFSLFTLLFLLLFFSISTVNAFFVVGKNIQQEEINNKSYCLSDKVSIQKNNKNTCFVLCAYYDNIFYKNINCNNFFKKKISIKINNSIFVNLSYFDYKIILKKTSPPYLTKNISNYTYHSLVKIIKSNI